MTVLIALEGVLKTEVGDPIPDGIKLFRVLATNYRVVFSSEQSKAQTEHWLKSNMILGYADVYDSSVFFHGQELRSRHIDVAKSVGKVELYIDADADFCAEALSKGIPAMMFAAPKFVRTTRNVKPWQDLTDEVERQKLALVETQLGDKIHRFE